MIYKAKAPAKINIGLRILGKRTDGYHNIETIFYPVKIYDEISVNIKPFKKNVIKVSAGKHSDIKNNSNICYKAAVKFLEEFNINDFYSISIRIKKKIPMGAGLAGGSSDAATVLKLLLRFFSEKIKLNKNSSLKKLAKLALELGSDVPFFLLNKPAYGVSRGEILTPLPSFKINKRILIVNPGIHISTPQAFRSLNIKTNRKAILKPVKHYNPADERLMINDFEKPAFKQFHEIEKIKLYMFKLGAEFALMSGSGSSVYGFIDKKYLPEAVKFFRKKKYRVFEA